MNTRWLDEGQLAAWVRLAAVLELLPGTLDSQLRRDAGLTHFEYLTLAMLSESPEQTLPMTLLAARTRATLARLSHVVRRLDERGYVERSPGHTDRRVTIARLTPAGFNKVRETAPGHVATVRQYVIDALTAEQVTQLTVITDAILLRLDPEGTTANTGNRFNPGR